MSSPGRGALVPSGGDYVPGHLHAPREPSWVTRARGGVPLGRALPTDRPPASLAARPPTTAFEATRPRKRGANLTPGARWLIGALAPGRPSHSSPPGAGSSDQAFGGREHIFFFPHRKPRPAKWFWWRRAPGSGATRDGTILDL